MSAEYIDDSDLTEIMILPDGRIYAFGLSEAVRDVLTPLQQETEAPATEPASTSTVEPLQLVPGIVLSGQVASPY